MKFWITKYALTSGIFEAEGEISTNSSKAIRVHREGRYMELFWTEGKEWHKDEDSARHRAIAMRDAKIYSLKRQIEKPGSLQF